MKEELHRHEPARRRHPLVRDDARDGALVHPDVLGDVAQDERLEVRDAVVEEVALLLHDGLGDPHDRALPLVEALEEPLRRAHLLAQVALPLAVEVRVARQQHPPVQGGHLQARKAVVVEDDDVVVLDLHDGDVGLDVDRAGRVVAAAGFRVQLADPLEGLLDLLDRDAHLAREKGRGLGPELREAVGHELHEEGRRDVRGTRLQEEDLRQVAPADADRVERLEERERLLGGLERARDGLGRLLERHPQAAVRIDVSDQEAAGLAHVRRRVRDAELLREMGLEPGGRLGAVLEGELLGLLAHAGGRGGAFHVVAEIRLELEVGERVVRGAGRGIDDRLRGGDVRRRRGQGLGRFGARVRVRRRGGELAVVGDGGLERRVRSLGRGSEIQLAGLGGARLLVGPSRLLGVLLVQHRVRDELLVHHVLELQARHLQELDRLLQRRRHDEALRESQREFLFESHLRFGSPTCRAGLGTILALRLSPAGTPRRDTPGGLPGRPKASRESPS